MHIPLWSVVTLLTELFITASVYLIIWRGYRTGVFMRLFAFAVLTYELLFNVTYMLSREVAAPGATIYSPYETTLAIFHGIFSLIMFVALVTFFLLAARGYARGENYFQCNPRATVIFVAAWAVSILSGLTFFVSLYLV